MAYVHDGTRRVASASASIGAVVVAALIPKCPLCVAAALSAIGVGASLAPIVRPVGLVVAAVALAAAARVEWRRRKRLTCGTCR